MIVNDEPMEFIQGIWVSFSNMYILNKNKWSSNKAYSIDKSKATQINESCNLKYMNNIQSWKVVSHHQKFWTLNARVQPYLQQLIEKTLASNQQLWQNPFVKFYTKEEKP